MAGDYIARCPITGETYTFLAHPLSVVTGELISMNLAHKDHPAYELYRIIHGIGEVRVGRLWREFGRDFDENNCWKLEPEQAMKIVVNCEFARGELGEGMPWKMSSDYKLNSYNDPCKHCTPTPEGLVCPFIVEAWNQAGYDKTIMCLRCILEAAEVLGLTK